MLGAYGRHQELHIVRGVCSLKEWQDERTVNDLGLSGVSIFAIKC